MVNHFYQAESAMSYRRSDPVSAGICAEHTLSTHNELVMSHLLGGVASCAASARDLVATSWISFQLSAENDALTSI
jgi:hypothetical protein